VNVLRTSDRVVVSNTGLPTGDRPPNEAFLAWHDSFKAGAPTLPSPVPTSTDDPAHAANTEAWKVLRAFVGQVAGAEGRPHTTIAGGGHLIQEDRGEELAALIAGFIEATPAP
jgi:haloalkane dehalogenase